MAGWPARSTLVSPTIVMPPWFWCPPAPTRRRPLAAAAEIAAATGMVFAVFADDDSLAAFGPNPLDPLCRVNSAMAGRQQGRREAQAVARLLGV